MEFPFNDISIKKMTAKSQKNSIKKRNPYDNKIKVLTIQTATINPLI